MCRLLEANCVTCSHIDKFAPFHNRMSVGPKAFVKFLQTIYSYSAESARKIDVQLDFYYTGCLIDIWGGKVNFLIKKVEKVIGPSYFTVKLLVHKTTSDRPSTEQYGPSKQGNL